MQLSPPDGGSEEYGLEQRDVDRAARVVYVRRAYANGQLKHTKTLLRRTIGAVASQAAERVRHAARIS